MKRPCTTRTVVLLDEAFEYTPTGTGTATSKRSFTCIGYNLYRSWAGGRGDVAESAGPLPTAGPYLPWPHFPRVFIEAKGLPKSTSTGAHSESVIRAPGSLIVGLRLLLAPCARHPPDGDRHVELGPSLSPPDAGPRLQAAVMVYSCIGPRGAAVSGKRRGGNTHSATVCSRWCRSGVSFETAAPW